MAGLEPSYRRILKSECWWALLIWPAAEIRLEATLKVRSKTSWLSD